MLCRQVYKELKWQSNKTLKIERMTFFEKLADWSVSGVNFNVTEFGGPQCLEQLSTTRRIGETFVAIFFSSGLLYSGFNSFSKVRVSI